MGVVSSVAKKAAKKTASAAAKKGAAKTAAKKAVKKVAAPKPLNAVGMRFDMGAGAQMGSAAPARSSYIPGKAGSTKPARGTPMKPKAAAARVGTGSAAGMVPVAPYKPLLSAKQVRKLGAAGGSAAITGGMVATAEQKEKALNRAAIRRR